MSQGWRNGLWLVLVCSSLACSKPDAPANNSEGGPATAANSPGGLKLPPEPEGDGNSGTARASDKSGHAKASLGLDDEDPFKGTSKKSPIEQGALRKSLAGRWILVLTRPGQDGATEIDFHTGIVVIAAGKAADGGLNAKWTAPTEVLPPSKLSTSEIDNNQVRLTFEVGGSTLDFQGTLKDGVVYGNAIFGSALFGNCLPARLLATKEESLEGFNASPEPVDARALVQAFNQQEIPAALKALKKFVTDRPLSPLGMKAWEGRIRGSAILDLPSEDIEQLIADYDAAMARWGLRLQQTAKVNAAIILAQARYSPDFSLKYISATEKSLADESLKDLTNPLKSARDALLTVQALKYIDSDDDDRADKAFGFLTKLRGKSPFDPPVLYGLARYQEKAKRIDEALALYGELASLPMLEGLLQREWSLKSDGPKRELPSASLVRLWEAKHGKTDGLDEFKDEIYRKRVLSFADKPAEEAPKGNRLVLCELFTGSSCPPCVGADFATGALEITYPKTQVIVLRYHQHIPGPDPLTNADGEDRFTSYYHLQSTPTVFLNGAPVNNVGGFLPNSPDIYRGLKTLVDQQLEQKAAVKVRINARILEGNLQIVADVQGLDELKDDAKDLRLRVIIAEDEVHFLARNGVRSHEMIVRRMIGGPGGVELKDGKLAVKESIPLSELKSSLTEYLTKYEESEMIDFPTKPLDLKRLHVVAFVQNDESHEILQTNAIAVVSTDSAAAETITPAAGKAAAKKPKSDE